MINDNYRHIAQLYREPDEIPLKLVLGDIFLLHSFVVITKAYTKAK